MTMNANTNSSRLFQFYMDSFFKFPKDIRNDMIYCQRALRDHIKVHQMVLDVFEAQPNKDTVHRNNILNEIESEIYEINAEQQYLFLRLRRVIEEFYKMLRKNNIPVEQTTTNNLISREVVPFIKKSVLKINPVAVQYRLDEEMLVQKYFEVQQDETTTGGGKNEENRNGNGGVCEVIDLCDNDDMDVVEVEPTPAANKTYGNKPQSRFKSHEIDNKYVLSQMSLLKPIEQCLVVPGGRMNTQQSDNDVLMINTTDPKIEPQMAEAVKNQETEASKSVKLSRMNLRQALKRAHNVVSHTQPTKEKLLKSPTSGPPSPPGSKKQQNDPKQRTTRATTQAASSAQATGSSITIDTKTGDLINTSSSDDSNIERDPTSPHPFWPDEMLETRTQPAEYGQEMFLRLFSLFTPEMHVHMQQRRSKRRRRPVQSNERSDFHYGRIEYANFPATKDQKKERKTFLLSPQAKAKKPKRSSAEKIEESSNGPAGTVVSISSSSSSASSRSNSSSPNEKGSCNECLKATGILDSCIACKAYFHQSCHSEETMQVNDDPIKIEDSPSTSEPEKHCPQCKSKQSKMLKKESVQNRTLSDAAKSLEIRMAQQRDRRVQLQNASKMYKLQMMNLFNIVKKLKNDASEGVE